MIEVVLNVFEQKKEKYPYLGVHENGAVVLFSSSETGTQINKNSFHDAGCFKESWCEKNFKPLQGSITLSNA